MDFDRCFTSNGIVMGFYRKMKITFTVLSAAVFAAFITFVSVKRWQTEEDVAKHEKKRIVGFQSTGS